MSWVWGLSWFGHCLGNASEHWAQLAHSLAWLQDQGLGVVCAACTTLCVSM
jgi:hypothetical protein